MTELQPKKSLGQHWLHDKSVLVAMCEAAEVGKDDTVLEIGPGTGTLSRVLLDVGTKVVAVEKDENLAQKLKQSFDGRNFTLYEEDILQFDLTSLPSAYKLVANIPYYLTNNLLKVLSESSNPPQHMALLVQKEVAERAAAKPGQMSLLSVSLQFYYHVSLGLIVPAKLFTPPPKVDSRILKLVHHEKPLFPATDSKLFFRVIKAGFSSKRKTLLNSLSAGLHLGKTEVREILEQSKLNPQSRPQELSLQDWHRLYLALQ